MIKRKDLVDIGDKNYHQRQNEVMQCQDCGEIMGGTRGDYWREDMEYIFHCIECESENIALVIPQMCHKIVKQYCWAPRM